ncbi:MAG: phytase [Acidiferrobacterales bacterium]|nr:phytase [Acidiferrobacterales bacterium]
MRYLLLFLSIGLGLTACANTSDINYPVKTVTAMFETPVMQSEGDSADDPAIYISPNGGGFIAGTDKQAGLYIYNLDGTLRAFMPVGMVNNVDLRSDFVYQGQDHVLLVASDDETNAIVTLLYNPATDRFITPNNARLATGSVSPYGICLGQMEDGSFHAGVTTKDGRFVQYAVSADESMHLAKLREVAVGGQTEGCDFDDRRSVVYVGVEESALIHFPSNPSDKTLPITVANVGQFGLKADLEGVTTYPVGQNEGYIIVSSQGNNSFGVFALPSYSFVGRFHIVSDIVDGVSSTDGIAVTSKSTPKFPKGFLVVQDDIDNTSPSEVRKKQNFKVIDWRDIELQLSQ